MRIRTISVLFANLIGYSVLAKDVGAVLRDYRNYIHPQKQLSLQVQELKVAWPDLSWRTI